MSKMLQVVEELRDRLGSMADQEQKLIGSLRDALNRVDQKLLQDVAILREQKERSVILIARACSFGVFQRSHTGLARNSDVSVSERPFGPRPR